MPKTFKDFLPTKDYAGRLVLGLVLLIAGQLMTQYDGVVFSILRWVFFISAVVNYGMVLFLYQRQKQEKMEAREKETQPAEPQK